MEQQIQNISSRMVNLQFSIPLLDFDKIDITDNVCGF